MALELTSPAFDDGQRIPERYGYTERNVNPPLDIDGVPEDTVSLALIVDDPDAVGPAGKIWDHWIVWGIPPSVDTIPENWNAAAAGATEGRNDFGEVGYGGPKPPDREHTYQFELFALETDVDIPRSSQADDLRTAMEGSVLDEDLLTGTYAP